MRALMAPARLAAAAGRAHQAFSEVGGYRSLFANRTALGAGVGALYGASGDNGSFGNALKGAALGAGVARYGGMFMKSGMTGGIGIRGAGMRTAALMSKDVRPFARATGRFIGSTAVKANNGYNKFRGLFR